MADELGWLPFSKAEEAQALRALIKAHGRDAIAAHFNLDGINDAVTHHEEGQMSTVSKARTDFHKVAAEIRARDKCTRLEALERARMEQPGVFKAYQEEAPQLTVVRGHGFAKVRHERPEAAIEFNKRVADIRSRDKCSRIEAMEKARREYPDEYEEFQNS